jgi:phosphatidylglycerol:prolipoprotein diacylglycerol transferase
LNVFFIEKIRINNEYNIFGFGITQAEIISSIMIIIGIAGTILFFKKRPSNKCMAECKDENSGTSKT